MKHLPRVESIRALLSEQRLQAMIVTEPAHVRYVSGFSGSAGICIITPTRQYFITDRRYQTQAPEEVKGFTIVVSKLSLFPLIAEHKMIAPKAVVGIESQHLPVAEFENLKILLPGRRFKSATKIIETVTAVKDKYEIEMIHSACQITDKVFKKILPMMKPGVRECDIAARISYYHRIFGAECDAFDPIVASGERGALPHAHASEKKFNKGDLVVLDFGCRYHGYNSDMTRTVVVGKPSAKIKKMYQTVLDAQLKAIEAVKSGVKAHAIDAAARNHITQQGFGKYFIHSLGHGLGIHVHDPLRLSTVSKSILEPGNVTTIEPGIYLPGFGGVRIEDDIVVREQGCDILNTSTKELISV